MPAGPSVLRAVARFDSAARPRPHRDRRGPTRCEPQTAPPHRVVGPGSGLLEVTLARLGQGRSSLSRYPAPTTEASILRIGPR